jgi:hypothetical protein
MLAPRWRAPLLILGFVSLASGIAGGLVRAGLASMPAPQFSIPLHGALMVSGFFGTVISLERAVARARLWAYAAPLACGLGGIALLAGEIATGYWLLAAAAAILLASTATLGAHQPSLETWTLSLGAACWLTGNLLLAAGFPVATVAGWWIAFFALTIAAERLELSRYLPRPPAVRRIFIAIVAAIVVAAFFGAGPLGVALLALAIWLLAFDLARITIRQTKLPRYIAACLLAGYAWLAVGGALFALGSSYDAAVHAVMVGFVFSMVFGHAPVILPAVLRIALPYSAWLYLPLALLHGSLALRVIGDLTELGAVRIAGAAGNAAAIMLFIVTAAWLALAARTRS